MLDIDPTMVADCCLYQLFLHCNFHTFQWVAHASNCWMCDGIIQGDRARDSSIALHGKLNWERGAPLVNGVLRKFMKHTEPPFLILQDDDVYEEGPYRWISVTSRNTKFMVCKLYLQRHHLSSWHLKDRITQFRCHMACLSIPTTLVC